MLAITTGEPAGIGPDICLDIANSDLAQHCVLIGCPALLESRAKAMGRTFLWQAWQADQSMPLKPGHLWLEAIATADEVTSGQLNPRNSAYVMQLLDRAIKGCQNGEFKAMVTAPVQKSVINDAGFAFSGHTEYLAQQTHTDKVVMMLANEKLRVALVTTHLPLAKVSQAITPSILEKTLRIVHHDLIHHFGIEQPRISVCGLNPHAGEAGHMGMEEIEVIQPCIEKLRKDGLNLSDALPADTAFTPSALTGVDAVVSMYHDQGLPVIKSQSFGEVVNITLGLPIIRTSVDHGTALSIAGSGKALSTSLFSAIERALEMAA